MHCLSLGRKCYWLHTDMHTHTCAHYINKCSTLIPKEQRWKNINLNPVAHAIRDLLKIHRKKNPC